MRWGNLTWFLTSKCQNLRISSRKFNGFFNGNRQMDFSKYLIEGAC